jgi:hypothetical protein
MRIGYDGVGAGKQSEVWWWWWWGLCVCIHEMCGTGKQWCREADLNAPGGCMPASYIHLIRLQAGQSQTVFNVLSGGWIWEK